MDVNMNRVPFFIFILVIKAVNGSQLLQLEIGKPANIKFHHTNSPETSITCLKNEQDEVFNWSTGKNETFLLSWSTRNLKFTKYPLKFEIYIPAVIDNDDGQYKCTVISSKFAEDISRRILTYKPIIENSTFHITPPPNEERLVLLSADQEVTVTSDAGCNKPQVNLTIYWNTQVLESASKPCAPGGYQRTILTWQGIVSEKYSKLIIRVSHPSVSGRQRNLTYNVTLKGKCDDNPCQNGGSCTGDTVQYTCTCSSGFEGENCQTKRLGTMQWYFKLTIALVCLAVIILSLIIIIRRIRVDYIRFFNKTGKERSFKNYLMFRCDKEKNETENGETSPLRTINQEVTKSDGKTDDGESHVQALATPEIGEPQNIISDSQADPQSSQYPTAPPRNEEQESGNETQGDINSSHDSKHSPNTAGSESCKSETKSTKSTKTTDRSPDGSEEQAGRDRSPGSGQTSSDGT